MALKLPSFCFDVECDESGHYYDVCKKQYFAYPKSAQSWQIGLTICPGF